MGRWWPLTGFLVWLLFAAGVIATHRGHPREPRAARLRAVHAVPVETALADQLDPFFQERFRTVNGARFGITRVPTVHDHPGIAYLAEGTAAERAVVRAVKRSGREALFYVAGRGVAWEPEAVRSPASRYARLPHDLSSPILIAGPPQPSALPARAELRRKAMAAFRAFERSDAYEFDSGRWRVVARPVRAASPACLSCHRTSAAEPALRPGDAIGVALYGFARRGVPGKDSAQTPAAVPGRLP